MILRSILALSLLALATPLLAQEEEAAAEESPWSGNVKFGYIATSGNTENESMNSSFELNYKPGDWEHQLRGAAIISLGNRLAPPGTFTGPPENFAKLSQYRRAADAPDPGNQ